MGKMLGGKNTLGLKNPVTGEDKGVAQATKEAVKEVLPGNPGELHGPSPNPHTNLLIADVVLRGSSLVARRAVERGLLGSKYTPRKANAILKGRTWGETLLHTAIARVAVRSVPGAIIVGGGLIAKTLYDRSRSYQARLQGDAKLHDMSKDGKEKV